MSWRSNYELSPEYTLLNINVVLFSLRVEQLTDSRPRQVFPYPRRVCPSDHVARQAFRRDAEHDNKGQLTQQSARHCRWSSSDRSRRSPYRIPAGIIYPTLDKLGSLFQ